MVLLDNDGFLSALTKLFQTSKMSGSIFLTMKKYNGRTKPRPRTGKSHGSGGAEPEDNLCLLRATNGKKKISTVISSKEVTRFQMAYGSLLKAHIDGLRRRDKRGTKTSTNVKVKQKKVTA